SQVIARHNLTPAGEIATLGLSVLRVAADQSPQAVVKNIKSIHTASVQYAEVDQLLAPTFVPDDPLFPDQWAHTNINTPGAWDITTGDDDVVVALLDTGVNEIHEDLDPARFVPGWNTY